MAGLWVVRLQLRAGAQLRRHVASSVTQAVDLTLILSHVGKLMRACVTSVHFASTTDLLPNAERASFLVVGDRLHQDALVGAPGIGLLSTVGVASLRGAVRGGTRPAAAAAAAPLPAVWPGCSCCRSPVTRASRARPLH